MSLSLAAATEVTNVAGQNLSVEDDLLQLNNKDIKILCWVISRPGGTDAARNVNPGIKVPATAEANLKHMIYQLCHVVCCSWPIVWANVMLISLRQLAAQVEMEESHNLIIPVVAAV